MCDFEGVFVRNAFGSIFEYCFIHAFVLGAFRIRGLKG